MNGYIIGVDVGSSKVCASAGIMDKKGNIKIVGISSLPCRSINKGNINDNFEVSYALNDCIEQLEKMIDTKIDEVYISVPANLCNLENNKGLVKIEAEDKEIRPSDVAAVIRDACSIKGKADVQSVSAVPITYSIDGFENIKDPVGMCGSNLEVEARVVTTSQNILDSYFDSINKAGLKVKNVLFQPEAEAEIIFSKDEKKGITLIVDAGADKIDLSIFDKGYISYISSIPLGGNSITKDISICLKISRDEAEKLKIKYNTLKKLGAEETIILKNSLDNNGEVNYNTLIDIMEARIEELFELIRGNLTENGYFDDISSVVLIGGGLALFGGIIDIGKNILQKPLRIGVPEYIGTASPLYACSVGIVNQIFNPDNKYYITDNSKYNREEYAGKNKKSSVGGVFLRIKEFLGDIF